MTLYHFKRYEPIAKGCWGIDFLNGHLGQILKDTRKSRWRWTVQIYTFRIQWGLNL